MLHIVNKSPFERTNLEACLTRAKEGSAVLLTEDGVYAALANTKFAATLADAAKSLKVFVLGPDLAARGFGEAPLVDGISVVDYGGFVDLAVEHGTTQSWL